MIPVHYLYPAAVPYACVNYGEALCPEDIGKQAICIDGDIGMVIDELRMSDGKGNG